MLRANFHIHTKYSFDGYNSFRSIYKYAKKASIDLIAITDHDTIEGAVEFQKWLINRKLNDLQVIVGEEVTCSDGTHIIGLFLNHHVDRDDPRVVTDNILNQRGLVYLPHPNRKDGIMHSEYKNYCFEHSNFIEIYNAKINYSYCKEAMNLLENCNLIPLGGSDAHYNLDIGKCVVELCIDTNNDKSDIKEILTHLCRNQIKIYGYKKSNSHVYFPFYYKYKERLNLPIWIRKLAKKIIPLLKNYKERNRNIILELFYDGNK